MKVATNGSTGAETSSVGVPELEDAAVADHADAVGERRGVLEVVGDEQRRQCQRWSSSRSSARTPARVWASSAESGSSSSSTAGIARERAGERDALALAAGELAHPGAGEMADAEALEELVDARAVAGPEAHVPEHVEMGEERVLLEEVADPPVLGGDVHSAAGVQQHPSVDGDRARLGLQQAGDDAEHGRLAGARRADERQRLAGLDGSGRLTRRRSEEGE